MQTQKPFKLLTSALQLKQALDGLTEASQTLDSAQDRIQKLEKQTSDLFEGALGEKGAKTNSLLVAAQHKFRNLRNALLKSQKTCDRARKDFEAHVEEFETILAQHNRVQAMADVEAATRQVVTSVFQQSLQNFINERISLTSKEMTLGNFELPEESHGYIPYSMDGFVDMLVRVNEMLTLDPEYYSDSSRYRPISFLEIGSGPGRLLMVAKLSNLLNCHRYAGFDLNNETVLLGQKALGLENELFVANALEFDYSEFDVMFSYRPIRVPEMQIALEKRIVETMKPGAYLMAPLSEDLARYPDLRCVNKPLATWRKSVPDGDS